MNQLPEAIMKIIDAGGSQQKIAKSVAAYLVTQRQTSELSSVMRKVEQLRFRRDGALEVVVTATHPLSSALKNRISSIFDAKDVRIIEVIDKDLIGGVKVRALDKTADFSVQARLQRLRSGRSI
jgi:F-type H+-transporting ATPase subunit delta